MRRKAPTDSGLRRTSVTKTTTITKTTTKKSLVTDNPLVNRKKSGRLSVSVLASSSQLPVTMSDIEDTPEYDTVSIPVSMPVSIPVSMPVSIPVSLPVVNPVEMPVVTVPTSTVAPTYDTDVIASDSKDTHSITREDNTTAMKSRRKSSPTASISVPCVPITPVPKIDEMSKDRGSACMDDYLSTQQVEFLNSIQIEESLINTTSLSANGSIADDKAKHKEKNDNWQKHLTQRHLNLLNKIKTEGQVQTHSLTHSLTYSLTHSAAVSQPGQHGGLGIQVS